MIPTSAFAVASYCNDWMHGGWKEMLEHCEQCFGYTAQTPRDLNNGKTPRGFKIPEYLPTSEPVDIVPVILNYGTHEQTVTFKSSYKDGKWRVDPKFEKVGKTE
jgi:hypothetical protein